MKIKIYIDEVAITHNWIKFSGGELHPIVDIPSTIVDRKNSVIRIEAFLKTSDDIMHLLLIKNAIENRMHFGNKCVWELFLHYTPYSRQDRINNKGEAFGIKVFSQLINSMNFDKVSLCDNHSDVGTALIHNSKNVEQVQLIQIFCPKLYNRLVCKHYTHIISPDAGALKKTHKLADVFGIPVIRADKVRSTSNGHISDIRIIDECPSDAKILVLDDICDGGATFVKLAQAVNSKKITETQIDMFEASSDSTTKTVAELDLYITNGIFSKGKQVITDVYDNVYVAFDWTKQE